MKLKQLLQPRMYDLILADPPWRYNFSKSKSRQVENQYETMSLDEISKLPVPAAVNCLLYLWATAPKLQEALFVMQAWGFSYKTHMVWDKERVGMGYWFRGQHELLLVGTRGKFPPPSAGLRVPSVYREKRSSQHSRKPRMIHEAAHIWYPNSRKLEMFARTETEGWDCWGQEV